MQNPDETRINRLVWCERERDDVVDVWTVRVLAAATTRRRIRCHAGV